MPSSSLSTDLCPSLTGKKIGSNILSRGTTIIIPSRGERFLNNTIREVLNNAKGEFEIIVVLDGYKPAELITDPMVRYIRLPKNDLIMQKRQGINEAVKQAKYDHIMSLDAHCLIGFGFNLILERDCKDDQVMMPSQFRLDGKEWRIWQDDRPPIDYQYWRWQSIKYKALYGHPWNARTIEHKDIMIDETLVMGGACWFMHKSWFNKLGLMDWKGFKGWGQEAEEIVFKTYLNGGKTMVNKNTWFAHLFKGSVWGRGFILREVIESGEFSWNFIVNEHRKEFVEFIRHFMPIPRWPEDFEKYL